MAGFAYQYSASFLNKRILDGIATQKYARSAFLLLLLGVTGGGGENLQIGRPNEGLYLSGGNIQQAQRESVRGTYEFTQRIQSSKTHNTQVTGAMGNMPTVASPTTLGQDVVLQNSAAWRWCMNIDTPITVWNSTLKLAVAKADEDGGVAAGVMLEEAQQVGIEEHYDNLNSRVIYGAPTNQDAFQWNDIAGVISACTTNNRYGMIDRSTLAANSPWVPQFVSSNFSLDATRIIDYANTTLGINVFGGGVTAIIAGGSNYLALKNQALARDKGGYIVQDAAKGGLPGLAKYGITKEIVRCNNAFICHEPFLDTVYGLDSNGNPLYSAQSGYVFALNLRYWEFITHPDATMKAEPLVDLHDKAQGAADISQSFVRTWAQLLCRRPDCNALFTNLS